MFSAKLNISGDLLPVVVMSVPVVVVVHGNQVLLTTYPNIGALNN